MIISCILGLRQLQ